jgi:hypothetical protein
MGKGSGCIQQPISLKDYQHRVGNSVMTVDDMNVYTFRTGKHTVSICDEVEFGSDDTLVIAAGSDVTLDGKLTINHETNGITRITVNGTLRVESNATIDLGNITNGGKGVVVNSENSLYIGGILIIGNVTGSVVSSVFNSVGLKVSANGNVTLTDEGSITIGNVTGGASANEGSGIGMHIKGGTFNQKGGEIIVGDVDVGISDLFRGAGVYVIDDGIFNQEDGSIKLNDVSMGVLVGYLGASPEEAGGSQFIQSGTGSITINNVHLNSGVYVADQFIQSGTGSITIDNVTDEDIDANGVRVKGTLTQSEEGSITVKNVTGVFARGVRVETGGLFNVIDLKITGEEDVIGFYCRDVDGVVNSGKVSVTGIGALSYANYKADAPGLAEPSTPSPTADPNKNLYFISLNGGIYTY